MKIAIAYLTKDRAELTKQTLPALLDGARKHQYHLFCFDGSTTQEAEDFIAEAAYPTGTVIHNVRGGADTAIVFALTHLLKHKEQYDVIGLHENDVLLPEKWFPKTVSLLEKAKADGLEVGAFSARCYEDRVLIQREGYAVCHNLGAGQVLFTRRAVEIILENYRTGWTTENRRIFNQLSGLDIARWWAFRGEQHCLTADWHFDVALAAHGYASVALTPCLAQMVGQDPPLEKQGLKLVEAPVEARCDDKAFTVYAHRLAAISQRFFMTTYKQRLRQETGEVVLFPHQIHGYFSGDWKTKWSQGFGPFAFVAAVNSELTLLLYGAASFLLSGGKNGGKVRIEDLASGGIYEPELPPEGEQKQVMNIHVPATVSYRNVCLTILSDGVVFYGITTSELQPVQAAPSFDFSQLPPVA